MAGFADDALVLDTHPYRDRHQLLSVLTPHHGQVRGVLRGARGGKSPRASATQILSLVRVSGHQSPTAELATFHEVRLLISPFPLAASLSRAAAAAVVAELLLTFCPAGEPAPLPFRLGSSLLEALLDGHDTGVVVSYAELWMLLLGGVLPSLDSCDRCSAELADEARIDLGGGQVLCGGCAPAQADAVDPLSRAFLISCRRLPAREVPAPVPPLVVSWLDRLVHAEAERPMRALTFFRRHAGPE